jgi:hypothetical protein
VNTDYIEYRDAELCLEPRLPFIVDQGVVAVRTTLDRRVETPVLIIPPGGLWPGWEPWDGYWIEVTYGATRTPPDCDPSVLRAARANLEWQVLLSRQNIADTLPDFLRRLGPTTRLSVAYATTFRREVLSRHITLLGNRIRRYTVRRPGTNFYDNIVAPIEEA